MNKKQLFLFLCWKLGLFKLARKLYKNNLQILCYHGFAADDEARFRPKLFITPGLFAQRIDTLKKYNFNVVALDSALRDLRDDRLDENTIVITIDDGFYNIKEIADPILTGSSFPYTVYLTTYYVEKQTPIFRLAVQYMFWKTGEESIDTSEFEWLPGRFLGNQSLAGQNRQDLYSEIMDYGEKQLTEDERVELSKRLGELLGVDYEEIRSSRSMSLLSLKECEELSASGVDFQLHTHRHVLPDDAEGIKREIGDNKKVISLFKSQVAEHFCYPSGIWSDSQWPALEAEGVVSATTCLPGMNSNTTEMLGLNRFLDGENISDIEFLSEIHGFSELLRRIRSVGKRVLGSS